jgi:capsular polysaccharide biosynthesis protein
LHNSPVNGKGYRAPIEAGSGRGASAETYEGDEYFLSLGSLLRVLWQRLWVVSLVTVALAGAAVGFSLAQTPIYEASSTLLVGQQRGTNELPVAVYDLQQLTLTMAEGIASRPMAESTIRQLGLRTKPETLLANLSVEPVPETQFIEVSYSDASPERAQRVANTLGEVFSERISEVSPSANAITATVWERAVVPDYPVSPNPVRNGILALVLGLMLGVGLAFLLDYLDDSWRSPEEAERISGVPTFGVIPQFQIPKGKKGGY